MRMTQSFGRATVRNILGRHAGGQRYALAESRMVETLPRGEALRVTVRSAGQRSTYRQRRSAMLGTE
jgi:hypothetical protein